MEHLDCPICNSFGFYFIKLPCCHKSCCDECVFGETRHDGNCPFCQEHVEKKECHPEKTRNLLVASLYSVMSASREVTNEREQTNKNIDSLVYVVGKLVDQVREQDITIRRLEDKLDAVLGLTARKVRSPAIASPIDEKFPSDDFLQIYIKTLTGTTFNINAPHHCTIEDLKRFIENDCGIPVENQKLVYAGEQLHDERTLMEYDVKNGAQLHMVLGMRAQRNPDECQ